MTDPDHKPDDQTPKPSGKSSWWGPILFLGCVALLLYVADQIDKSSPGSGRSFVGWVVGLGALGIFFNIIWGKTTKETAGNLLGVVKWVVGIALFALVFGGLFQCSGSDDGVRGLPDNVRSR